MTQRLLFKFNNIAICILFCAAIFIPFAMGLIEEDKQVSILEKRSLAKLPGYPANILALPAYPQAFDNYYADHFGYRDWFSERYKITKHGLGDSPSKDVILGKDGWLFLGSVQKDTKAYDDPVGDARNVNLYTAAQLEQVAQHYATLAAKLEARGIQYILFIAPNKHSIYFDKLPDYITKVNEQSATDQLVNYLRQHTQVTVVDVRASLIKEKDNYQLYYKRGTHWNHYAANIVQFEIMQAVEKMFPGQIQPELFELQDNMRVGGDLASFIGISNVKDQNPLPKFEKTCNIRIYPPGAKAEQPYTLICEEQILKVIVFRDSFFTILRSYMARKFKHSTFIWEKLNYPSLKKFVLMEKPDLIIDEMVERNLPYIPEEMPYEK